MPRKVLVPALLVLALPACDGCEKKTAAPAEAAASTPATLAGEGDAGADADASRPRAMANCPTAVGGSTVRVEDVPRGVAVEITGADAATASEIRARMKKLTEADRNEAAAGVRHTGRGEGGGRYGRCTLVMRNTTLESVEIDGGVKATVTANDPAEVDWLRRETRERNREAAAPPRSP